MDGDPKQAVLGCPFPRCSGSCKSYQYEDGSWRVSCKQILSCDYGGPREDTEAAAVAAHNALCRKVALHGELVGLLEEISGVNSDAPCGDCQHVHSEGISPTCGIDALLTRARGETEAF